MKKRTKHLPLCISCLWRLNFPAHEIDQRTGYTNAHHSARSKWGAAAIPPRKTGGGRHFNSDAGHATSRSSIADTAGYSTPSPDPLTPLIQEVEHAFNTMTRPPMTNDRLIRILKRDYIFSQVA